MSNKGLMRFSCPPSITCVVCGKKVKARKLCETCYSRHQKAGTLDKFPHLTLQEYLDAIIEKTNSCWLWNGTRTTEGYGVLHLKKKMIPAHRFMFERCVRTIPGGLLVRHKCDNPPCVNPDHLELGTPKDNSRDAIERGQQPRGERQGAAKLTTADIVKIRADTRSLAQIAADFGVSFTNIHKIKKRQSWKHVT